MQAIKLRRAVKPLVFLILSIFFLVATDTLLWLAFLMLAIFYVFVTFKRIDKFTQVRVPHLSPEEFGLIGRYVVDFEKSLGLFMKLNNKTIFIDIREDKFLEQRKNFALYLFEKRELLEKNLNEFLETNNEFTNKQIIYIGLHSKDSRQGEVFWAPEGYTVLKELQFR